MPEETCPDTDPGVRVISPGEDDARTIARAMASPRAGAIIRCFQGRELSASGIAAALDIPIPTVMYHLDALVEAGLVEIARTRYSVKGKEIKMYRQSDQVFIVAPRQSDIREILLRYTSLFGVTILGAAVITLLARIGKTGTRDEHIAIIPPSLEKGMASGEAVDQVAVYSRVLTEPAGPEGEIWSAAPSPVLGPENGLIPDLALGILIGGCLVIAALIGMDLLARRKKQK